MASIPSRSSRSGKIVKSSRNPLGCYLLARPENRPKSFYVGSRRFDTDSVGFAIDHQLGETTSLFEVEFLSDNGNQKVIPGNDNAGHTHGAGLCAGTAKFANESDDCKAMLLYLKSL